MGCSDLTSKATLFKNIPGCGEEPLHPPPGICLSIKTGYMKKQIFLPASVQLSPLIILLCLQLSAGCNCPQQNNDAMKNKDIVRNAFEKWSRAEGNFFDLLAENVQWTITGNSPVAKTYTSKKQFIDEVIDPLNARLSKKILPRLKELYADGDMVIALWEGRAVARDSLVYKNTYSWYMQMKDKKIIRVVALFDSIEFTKIWERVSPEPMVIP